MSERGIRLPGLDGLRALAVLAVIFTHCWPQVLPGGWIGVDVFFVLSGFLITSILLAEHDRTGRISLRHFYARRALRLLPALAVTLVIGVLLAWAVYPGSAVDTLHEAIAAAIYAANWLVASGQVHSGLLVHTWTLSIEEQFYWTWPIALWVALSLGGRRATLWVAIALIVVVMLHRLGGVPGAYFRTDCRADSLLFGCAVAIAAAMGLFEGLPIRVIRGAGAAALVTLGFILAVAQQESPVMETVGFTITGAAAATVIVALAVRPLRVAVSVLRWLPFAWVGRRSYGIYLYAPLIQAILATRLGSQGLPAFLATIGITLPVAATSYRYLELPFLRRKDRAALQIAPPAAAAPVRVQTPSAAA